MSHLFSVVIGAINRQAAENERDAGAQFRVVDGFASPYPHYVLGMACIQHKPAQSHIVHAEVSATLFVHLAAGSQMPPSCLPAPALHIQVILTVLVCLFYGDVDYVAWNKVQGVCHVCGEVDLSVLTALHIMAAGDFVHIYHVRCILRVRKVMVVIYT